MDARPEMFDAEAVYASLTYAQAIPVVRDAMIALSAGRVRQVLRSFVGLGPGRTFAVMPAAFDDRGGFGAKLVSVFQHADHKAHEGVVVLFDGADGAPVCIADAAAVTAIRTAAASAVATDALARPDAGVLAVLGAGLQAAAHVEALRQVRDVREVRVWARDRGRAAAFAARVGGQAGAAREVVEGADIICTVTAATDPILPAEWVTPGAHVNLVGSSGPAQAEAEPALVAASRFVVDQRAHVLAHGGEFLRAKAAGLIGDDHIAAEIGEVLAGAVPGRRSPGEVTVYKSLGHAVQDLAVTAWLYRSSFAEPPVSRRP
jgi:ornithine cyclodeaminase/alanine dehydrogenase-like protein (mu-crystallin family)